MIISISGAARSGKDTIAQYLVRYHGFQRRAFADKVKDATRLIFGLDDRQLNGDLKEVIDDYWQRTPREIMQLVGTECMRQGYADDIWIKATTRGLPRPVVFSDTRFENEYDNLKDLGAVMWRVDRPDAPDISGIPGHVSEAGIDRDFDVVIVNDGTILDLHRKIEKILTA